MFIIYDLVFLIVAVIHLPIYLFRRKFQRGFRARLGFLPRGLALNKPIWIHAVSVGEVMAVRGLIEELRRVYPDKKFVISTVTATGNKIAQGIAKSGDFVTYFPLDVSFIVKNVIDQINPALFLIAETEIWPNLISYLYRKNTPIVVINNRISDSSFKGYLSIKFLLKPILDKINLFCVQTNRDAQRLMRLGVSEDKIQVTGNMKFDSADYADKKTADYADKYKSVLGLKKEERFFVVGSTHSGEEEIILSVYKKLLAEFPNLRLLIAPRHPERSSEIAKLVEGFGFEPVRISLLGSPARSLARSLKVFILDTIGQLINYYAIADIVFVAGSLVKKGGHNILEPASLEKPILFGPYMFNFRDIADLFLNNRAAIMVRNQEELKINIIDLLNNPKKMIELGQRAGQLILQNQGATKRNVQHITAYYRE